MLNDTIDPEIMAAMNAYKPEIARRWMQSMRDLFEDVVKKHGPAMSGVANCWTYAKVVRNTGLRKFLVSTTPGTGRVEGYEFNETRLAEAAEKVAEDTINAWAGKIQAKMCQMDSAVAHYVSGTSFQISGTRGGHKISIEQQMIINVSRLGTLFNQWPSRIYVDGKLTSEAAYKKMF